MTRDFAKPISTRQSSETPKRPRKSNSKSNIPEQAPSSERKSRKWQFALLGIIFLLGTFGYGLYHLRSIPAAAPVTSANAGKPEKSIKAAPKETTKQSTTATTPRFTFYNDLPKREIETSGANPYSPKGSDGVQYDYLLQAGSFRRYEDAHRQMGMIAMQGLKPYITESTSNDHGTWYRVMLGPYSSRSKMNSATDRLVSMSIQPLPKKIPREE